MKDKFFIVTNNPLVLKKLGNVSKKGAAIGELDLTGDAVTNENIYGYNIIYKPVSYEEILKEVRSKIHEGYILLSHPLSGSVKPNETPYKSVIISRRKGNADEQELSVKLIENAIEACGKFHVKTDKFNARVLEDFQLIDWTLLESAISSAE